MDHTQVAEDDKRIDHGNAAVLLDVGAAHLEGGAIGLKVAKDGHVILAFWRIQSRSYRVVRLSSSSNHQRIPMIL